MIRKKQNYLTHPWEESSQSDGVELALVLQLYHGLALGHLDWGADGLLSICCLGNYHFVRAEDTSCMPGDGHCSLLVGDEGHLPSRRGRKTFFPHAPLHDHHHQHDPEHNHLYAVADISHTRC
jgi:hypothetical protein